MAFLIITTLIKLIIIEFLFLLPLAAILTWMERRQSAYIQDRVGPTRAGITIFNHRFTLWGLIHIVADAIKMFFKEPFIPAKADKIFFKLAPLIPFAISLIIMALVPFGPDIKCIDIPIIGTWLLTNFPEYSNITLQIARVDTGLLLVFAISSLSIYGIILAGWASNNRYALLGGLRAVAQAISYEITLGLTIVGIFIIFGTAELSQIVAAQQQPLFTSLPTWGVFVQPLGAVFFFIAAIAESKRLPFDLPEGESEIIGYFVEYSSMAFGMFMLGEYLEIVVLSAVFTTLFFGGWHLPIIINLQINSFLAAILGMIIFGVKVFLLSALQLQIRWTLPRFRYDQLMRLGWKNILPIALANIFITAGLVWIDPTYKLAAYFGMGLTIIFIILVIIGPRRATLTATTSFNNPNQNQV
ncbi:MAG: NADH-quinone oxidoreductase subunit H [Deltaproteobacteria bacterium]|nr:NADH-quinone oxidoreductase subunit H [Deltaproteobacteria bacterium]